MPPVLHAIPCPVAVVAGSGGRFLAANPAWASVTGATLHASLAELFPSAAIALQALMSGAGARSCKALPMVAGPDHPTSCWDLDLVPHPDMPHAFLVTARAVTGADEPSVDPAQRQEERLRLALEAGGLAAWEIDIASGRLIREDGLYRMAGLQPELAAQGGIHGAFAALIHPEDRPMRDAALQRAIGSGPGSDYVVQFRLRHARTGAERWIATRGRLLPGPDGQPARLLGVSQDITERRMAEEAERRHATMLRQLRESDLFGITVCEGPNVLEANDAWLRLVGATRAEFEASGLSWAALTSPEYAERDAAMLRLLQQTGRAPAYEKEYMRRDGSRVPVLVGGALLDAVTGRRLVFVQDLSARKATEARLARYRAIAQQLRDIVLFLDRDGRVLDANAAAEAAYGYDRATLLTLNVRDLRAPDAMAELPDQFARAAADGILFETRHRRADGSCFPVEVNGAAAEIGGEKVVVSVVRDITDRRQAEEAHRQLAAVVEQSGDFIGITDLDGQIRFVNAAVCRLVGLPGLAAARQKRMADYFMPADWELVRRTAIPTAAANGSWEGEVRFRHFVTGRPLPVLFIIFPLRDAHGAVAGYATVTRDLSERKAAERALRESAARLARVQRIGRVGGFEIDLRSGVNRRSAEYMDLQGQVPRETLEHHQDWVHRLHPEDRERAEKRFLAAVADGSGETEYAQEYRIVTAAGEVRWIAARAEIERDSADHALRMLGAHVDVTELKAAEAALAESEARFRALVDAMPQLAFTALPNGVLDFSNRRWQEYTGHPPRHEGEVWIEVVHPEDRSQTLATWRRAVAGGTQYEVEHRLRGADSSWRWFLTRAVPLRRAEDAQLPILRWFGTSTDISDIVAAREAAARANEELEARVAERTRALSEAARELQAEIRRREEMQAALLQSQKLEALGQLTGGVAHDFNNILAAIQGGYRLLQRRVGEDARSQELIHHGRHAAERGARLIAQLMGFARKQELHPTLVDPTAVLSEAEDMVCHTVGSRIHCRFEIDAEVWPLLVDPVRLETVLLNLAANARDAMPQGGHLVIAARNAMAEELLPGLPAGRDYVRVSVADTGTGMDADTLRRATEPFFTTKPPGKGTGLGLASAHGFAAQSGGTLRLRSAPGEGTLVELFLPRAAVLPADNGHPAGARTAAGQDPASAPRQDDATILVVDDDDGVRPVTAALLRELGYRVIEASNAETAEAIGHAEPRIDMLVTDVVMPGAAGHVLARRLRAERPGLPVLYITGHSGSAALGDTPVLRKPFTDAALARAVLDGLGRRARATGAPGHSEVNSGLAGPADLGPRLRRPELRELFRHWLALREAAGGALPVPSALDFSLLPAATATGAFLVEALGDGRFRALAAGPAIAEGPGVTAPDGLPGAAWAAAHGRCAASGGALYDFARFLHPERRRPVLFERLVLPCSADGGNQVTHLAGLALLTDLPGPADRARPDAPATPYSDKRAS